ncbi:TIGR04211 family SH3 domain-containing protein [Inmirania thermothiophila]|uniref:SH3 domain protein n=1 Tax=Inmirania thermothiophila TaxID=1750597 RepID=A0A3N1Y832_9GAMM|nr:TIGR04211 family SH3 domain-containing protein [Inmirania thermothiophila]ROR34974.1 SH3 domain protein [Inmirania thermothiophila]
MRMRGIAGAVLLAAASAAAAETVYVVDILRVGVRPDPAGRGQPVEIVSTGTPLEVLQRGRGVLRVRTPAGREGWLAEVYTMPEPPARERLPALEARIAELEAALEQARTEAGQEAAQRRALAERVRETGEALARTEQALAAAQARARRAEAWREGLERRLGAAAGGVAVLVVGSFLAGSAWYRRRASRRLGGLRV